MKRTGQVHQRIFHAVWSHSSFHVLGNLQDLPSLCFEVSFFYYTIEVYTMPNTFLQYYIIVEWKNRKEPIQRRS